MVPKPILSAIRFLAQSGNQARIDAWPRYGVSTVTVTSRPSRGRTAVAVALRPADVTMISYAPRKPRVAYTPLPSVVPSAFVHHAFRTRSSHACRDGLIVQSLRHSAAVGRQCWPSQKPHMRMPFTFEWLNDTVST